MGNYLATLVRTSLQRSKRNCKRSVRPVSRIARKKVTQPTPRSSQPESEVPTLEPDVLRKVDLLGCAEWDSVEHWEAQSILREYVDVFAKDVLDLG